MIVADSNDIQGLQRMTAQTRVVISTVGPFAKYGEALIAACCKTGTSYCDITGESPWVESMITKYSEAAAKAGALIVNMTGFDSIPADVCAWMAADWLKTQRQTNTLHLQGYTEVKGGGVSGGTIASMLYMREPRVGAPKDEPTPSSKVGKPYLLNPPGYVPAQVRPLEKDQLLPRFDADIQKWTVPFLMAMVNTRVVRRSFAQSRQLDRVTGGFGEDASYNECMPAPGGGFFSALLVWLGLALMALVLAFGPTRALAVKFLPAPGEGPSAEKRAKTRFRHRVLGRGEDGSTVESSMSGTDPGYTETSKMIAEVGLMLSQDRSKLPINRLLQGVSAASTPGGFYTPSIVGGQVLVERLRSTGMKLEVGEWTQGKAAASSSSSSAKARD